MISFQPSFKRPVLIVLSIAAFGLLATAAHALDQDALSAQALIRRDNYGVPHIKAETEEAAFFAYGYCAAEDHLLQMARLYVRARGEEAEYFGEQFADSDFMNKLFHIYEVAQEGYAKSAPWWRRLLDAYAAGYNRYLHQHRGDVPAWVTPINGIDILAHVRRVIVLEFTTNFQQVNQLRKKLEPEQAAAAKTLFPAPAGELGSNMWAINGSRSGSGRAMLLGNPHLPWSGEFTWHEVHLTVPGEINFMGAALIGLPGPGVGWNEHLGWSHTVNPHDSDDIYALDLAPDDPHAYLYQGEPVAMRKETYTIQVKTDDGLQTRTRDVYWTHYGPVVLTHGGKAYAFSSPNFDDYRLVEEWYLMTKARNLDEYRQVLDMQAIPMFNICYADVDGNIYYLYNGRFPDRPGGYDWSGVVPGGAPATEWTHILPQARLPQLTNPKGGYVQNSNSSPWYTNLHAIIDRREYMPSLCPNFNSLRQQHGIRLIESDESITFEELRRYKFSMNLLLADRVKDDLIDIATGRTVGDTSLSEAVDLLDGWDNSVSRDAKGALLFVTFWDHYRKTANPIYDVSWNETYPASTPHGLGDRQAALNALAAAVKDMRGAFGRLDVPWGEVHRLRRGDVDVPIGGYTGDYGAFRVIGYERADDGKWVANGGDSYVFAVDFSSPPKAYSVLAYSQSDNPESPHYNDQSPLFANNQFKRAWFTEEEIAAHTEREYHP